MAIATFVVRLWAPIDSAQFLDLHLWLLPQATGLFVLGALAGEQGWVAPVPSWLLGRCRRALGLAAAVMAVLIVLSDGPESFKGGWHWEAAGFAAFEGTCSVSLALLLLDWARRHSVRPIRLEERLSRAAYVAFVAQGPVLVLLALALRSVPGGGDVRFVLLAVAGVAGSFLLGVVMSDRVGRGRRLRIPTWC